MSDVVNINERIRELEGQRDDLHDERTALIKRANALFAEIDQLSRKIGSLRQEVSNAGRLKREQQRQKEKVAT